MDNEQQPEPDPSAIRIRVLQILAEHTELAFSRVRDSPVVLGVPHLRAKERFDRYATIRSVALQLERDKLAEFVEGNAPILTGTIRIRLTAAGRALVAANAGR